MTHDVVIIGAGPAGSVAGLLLARHGWPVTLVEQRRFPSDKVCGECLSAMGIETLKRVGLADRLESNGPVRLTHAAVHATDGASARFPLPNPMWGISRRLLDDFLLRSAAEAGVRVLQPARCERIQPGVPPRVTIRRLENNRIEELCPDRVVVADGKSAIPLRPPPPTGDFGIKTHFEQVDGPRDTIELFGCRGLYGGLAAIENGRWNAAFSVPAERLRCHRGNVESLFAEIVAENESLSRRLKSARRVGDWLTTPLPRFEVRSRWPPGIIPIGNAAAALEPIGGEGMGLALRSAELAARSMINYPDAEAAPCLGLVDEYHSLWRVRRPACRIAARAVSVPMIGRVLPAVLSRVPAAGRAALRLMGK